MASACRSVRKIRCSLKQTFPAAMYLCPFCSMVPATRAAVCTIAVEACWRRCRDAHSPRKLLCGSSYPSLCIISSWRSNARKSAETTAGCDRRRLGRTTPFLRGRLRLEGAGCICVCRRQRDNSRSRQNPARVGDFSTVLETAKASSSLEKRVRTLREGIAQ